MPANPAKALQVVVSRARAQTAPEVVARTDHGYRLGLRSGGGRRAGAPRRRGRRPRGRGPPRPGPGPRPGAGGARPARAGQRGGRAARRAPAGRGPAPGDRRPPFSAAPCRDWATTTRPSRCSPACAPTTRPRSWPCCARPRPCTARRRRSRPTSGTAPTWPTGSASTPDRPSRRCTASCWRPTARCARGCASRPPRWSAATRTSGRSVPPSARRRVTSILGPGGLGKTRLAHLLGREADQPVVHFVELVGVASPEDVVGEVGSALGVRDSVSGRRVLTPEQRNDVRARIAQVLDQAPTLLILDNCEHVVEAVADLVAYLVATCSRLRVVTTTRAPLAIAAERVFPLGQLGRRGRRRPVLRSAPRRPARACALDDDAVRRVVRRLDGLPLAIELAAAKVRVMSVEDIDRRLDDRFALLRGGDRSAPDRHQTLVAVIDWSWNLLTEDERRALRWLSVFHDGFAMAGAGSLLGHDALDEVQSLVDQSLLTVIDAGGTVRYRMLETVREFGRMQLVGVGRGRRCRGGAPRLGPAARLDARRRALVAGAGRRGARDRGRGEQPRRRAPRRRRRAGPRCHRRAHGRPGGLLDRAWREHPGHRDHRGGRRRADRLAAGAGRDRRRGHRGRHHGAQHHGGRDRERTVVPGTPREVRRPDDRTACQGAGRRAGRAGRGRSDPHPGTAGADRRGARLRPRVRRDGAALVGALPRERRRPRAGPRGGRPAAWPWSRTPTGPGSGR